MWGKDTLIYVNILKLKVVQRRSNWSLETKSWDFLVDQNCERRFMTPYRRAELEHQKMIYLKPMIPTVR